MSASQTRVDCMRYFFCQPCSEKCSWIERPGSFDVRCEREGHGFFLGIFTGLCIELQ